MKKNIPESKSAAGLVKAQPNMCWVNASNMMFEDDCKESTYVEGIVLTPTGSMTPEHAWIVRNGEIIDPTLPDIELEYFPALEWPYTDFLKAHFKYPSKPFFRHGDFKVDAVQVEMDKARAAAKATASDRKAASPQSSE